MILRFFQKDPRKAVIEALHDRVGAASRHPFLYTDLGVPDTLEGRFESLSLHVILVLRRLRGLPPPAAEVGQDLVDLFFARLDRSLREMGVGDLAVPKRMKSLAEAFYGRARSYQKALDSSAPDALALVLGRNVIGSGDAEEPAGALAAYVLACEAALARQDLDDLVARGPAFQAPNELR